MFDPQILILGGVFLWIGLALAWGFFAVRGVIRARMGTSKGPAPTAMAEMSLVAFVLVTLYGYPILALLAAALPPVALVGFPSPSAFSQIMIRAALFAVPAGALALAFCLRRFPRGAFAIALPALLGLAVGLIAAEHFGRAALCGRAAELGLTEVRRHSVLWSLANTPREFQVEIHGLARRGDDHFGWSYSEMDWYELPDTVWSNVDSGPPACAG